MWSQSDRIRKLFRAPGLIRAHFWRTVRFDPAKTQTPRDHSAIRVHMSASSRRPRRMTRACGWSHPCPSPAPIPRTRRSFQRGIRIAARHALEVMRIPRWKERRVLGRRAHRKFITVGFADYNGSGASQPFHNGRSVGRNEVLQDARAARRRHIANDHVVLDCDGHAGERSDCISGRDLRIHAACLLDRALLAEREECVNILVRTLDLLVDVGNYFGRGEISVLIEADELFRRKVLEIHRSVITFGTLKSFTVFPASALPVLGATRSSRTACFTLVTTCAVGSIPPTSNLLSCSTYSTIALS